MEHSNSYLNFKEVCELLKITSHHLRSLIFKDQIPTTRIGRLIRFDRQQLADWIKENSKNSEGSRK
jgi:excisionase family DNA binding protein